MICHQIGSTTEIDLGGSVLFLEDVGESLYQLDRMLWQLKRAEKLKSLAGLLLGGFTEMKDQEPSFGFDANQIIDQITADLTIPVAFNWPTGHQPQNIALIQAASVELEVNADGASLRYTD